MTLLQFIGCLLFNVRHCSFILNNKKDRYLVLLRFLFVLIMNYSLLIEPQFFISFTIIKTVFDIMRSIIKFEASGVMTNEYKEMLIDDIVNIISFLIYAGG